MAAASRGWLVHVTQLPRLLLYQLVPPTKALYRQGDDSLSLLGQIYGRSTRTKRTFDISSTVRLGKSINI